MQTVGFSTVVMSSSNKNRATSQKLSASDPSDVVIDPARGGKFLSTLTDDAEPDPDPNLTGHMNPARYTKNPKQASGMKGDNTMTDQIQPTEQAELTAEAIIDPESSQADAPASPSRSARPPTCSRPTLSSPVCKTCSARPSPSSWSNAALCSIQPWPHPNSQPPPRKWSAAPSTVKSMKALPSSPPSCSRPSRRSGKKSPN